MTKHSICHRFTIIPSHGGEIHCLPSWLQVASDKTSKLRTSNLYCSFRPVKREHKVRGQRMTHIELHEMMPHDSSEDLRPRKRAKRVTAEHTLERVRNNQRKHRARRREYTSSLEDKLAEAEAALARAKGEIEELRTELARCRHDHNHDHVSPSDEILSRVDRRRRDSGVDRDGNRDGGDVFWDSASTSVVSPVDFLPEHIFPKVTSGENNFVAENPLSMPSNRSDDAFLRASDAAGATAKTSCCSSGASSCSSTATGPTDLTSLTETSNTEQPTDGCALGAKCCSDDLLAGVPQPGGVVGDASTTTSSEPSSPVLPSDVIRPEALEAVFREHDDGESTTPCAEAYSLISQQNFKGVSRHIVESWLWEGFRRARGPGEGCRVLNTILFGLLAFISDSDAPV
jgi:hypothetical protein